MKNRNNREGFAAIILIITVSILFFAISSIDLIEYNHFFDEVRNKESRLIAYYNAYSCIDQAMLGIATDYFFNTESAIDFPDLKCSIDSVKIDGDFRNITATGRQGRVRTVRNAKVSVTDNGLNVASMD